MKLDVSGLSFSYENKKLFEALDFSIEEGEFVSLLGPSGCGKSTILKLLTGVIKAETGRIQVDGQAVNGLSEHFAYMPQNDLLFPWKTILENVCLYGQIHGSFNEMKREAAENFPAFGLDGYENKYPSALSGGMRQRAAFLRTALCKADILLLDEPFGALDVITRGDMQDWLIGMRARLNRTVLLVTHDMDEALYLSDRILILNRTPAHITCEITIPDRERNREWLYRQGDLRQKIHSEIMSGRT
ncbi:ABC transporter ATP-binding protein [[Clostridium] symbiosum]|uniref:ABC transporter ATP-binding protein n=1 Tax=Clostridium symbiosum TaxID=1512 RepID=UPI001D0984E9|nr:ABC transporter ATP-binding protein [[Clostridium] symbiosum]MCB6610403.1 ABC transporter ATP-binding protein [[Clostridium] symbiosum]MCB6933453.1 ABC transporter ATP-binding protein [[Clostridium] symbiosum]